MKKTLLAAIIAATALVPPAAFAQDRGGRWGGRGGDGAPGVQQSAPQSRGSWRQSSGQPTQPQTAQPQQRQWNGGTRGDASGGQRQQYRGSWGQRPEGRAPQAQQPQAIQQQQQWRGGRSGGDRNRWNDGRAQAPQQFRGDRNGADRSRWNGGSGQAQQQFRGERNRYDGDRSQWNRGNRDWNRSGWNGSNAYRGDRDRGGRWNNGWRNDRRYDWRGYRSSNRSLYRLPRYYAPSGWGYGYRRFSIGYTLSSLLFAPQYWINDPFYYRLPEVDGPYRWVRYYNDALLVDVDTGEVVDVINDIFW